MYYGPTGRRFLFITKPGGMSRHEATTACYPIGGKLAQLQYNSDYAYLRDCLETTVWIASLDGKMYGPVAMYAGGVISVKADEDRPRGALCELC